MHPFGPVTVKVKVPAGIPEKVVEVPDPVEVVPPGLIVTVHVPGVGNPVSTTLPVARVQVGCVIAPITGAEGLEGDAGMTTSSDNVRETQPAALVTEKLYVPVGSPVIV